MSIRYYTERLPAHFNLKIQSDNFGNDRSLSIEDYNIDFADIHHKLQSEYHFHLLDDNWQDTPITHVYMISMLHELE